VAAATCAQNTRYGVGNPYLAWATGDSSFWSGLDIGNKYGTIRALSFAITICASQDIYCYTNRGGIQLLSHSKESRFIPMETNEL
jgi:hypothetical protein